MSAQVRAHYRRADDGRLVIDQLTVAAPAVTARMLRGISIDRMEATANAANVPTSTETLRRPQRGEGDEFYRRVASRYQELAGQTRAVAPLLAVEADVPVVTVHRWVREARRRGLLPPGRQGRTG